MNPIQAMSQLDVKRSRPRASTQDGVLALPPPEVDPNLYTQERLSRGVLYVTARRAERVISDPTNNLLTLYNTACEAAKAELDDGKRVEDIGHLLDEVRSYELEMSNRHWSTRVLNSKEEAIVRKLLDLRRCTFHARYGDYFQQIAKKLKSTAYTYKPDHWKAITEQPYWTATASKLDEEKAEWRARGSTNPDRVPVTLGIYEACKYLSIDHDAMFTVIHLYAERNTMFHRGLEEVLEASQYSQIAQWLYQDLKELSNLVPIEWVHEQSSMKMALVALRDLWFDISEGPDEPLAWVRTDELKKVAKHKRDKDAEALAQHSANVTAKVAELQRQGLDDEALLAQASIEPEDKSLPSIPGDAPTMVAKSRSKRKASDPLESKRRKERFWDVVYQFHGAHQAYDSTVQRQRAANTALLEYKSLYSSTPQSPIEAPAGLPEDHDVQGLAALERLESCQGLESGQEELDRVEKDLAESDDKE